MYLRIYFKPNRKVPGSQTSFVIIAHCDELGQDCKKWIHSVSTFLQFPNLQQSEEKEPLHHFFFP